MPLEEKMTQEETNEPKQDGVALNDEEELDLKVAVLMGQSLLDKGGFDVIHQAVDNSSDPSQVIGQFIMQMGQQLLESMPDDMRLSPKIMLARGGWVEQISDYIQEQGDVKKDIMDKAEVYVASTASQMAQQKQQQSGGTIDGVQAPPAPGPGLQGVMQ